MKKLIYNYMKPQNYYRRLFMFFSIISFILAFGMNDFSFGDFDFFLIKFVVIFFLIMFLSVAIEFLNSGEYISPLEIYDLEIFFRELKDDFKSNTYEKYFFKYNPKVKKNFIKIFSKFGKYFLSSVRKVDNHYELIFINNITFYRYFIFRFFAKKGIHKLIIKKINGEFKIINVK